MALAATAPELPELVDWELAARLGRRVAGGVALPARDAWRRQLSELSARADLAVADLTGLGGELPPPVAEPLDRGQWVEENLATLRRVLQPVAEKVARRRSWRARGVLAGAVRAGTRAVLGAQAGTLLGYLGQRVLGQYDLPLPGPEGAGGQGQAGRPADGAVWYVVPNLVMIERRYGFRPDHFRLWIALHESTHRRQFRGVAWLPGHVQGLLDEYVSTLDVDEEALKRIGRRGRELAGRVLAGEQLGLMDFLVTGEQRAIVDRIQATMSVVEGHGELVMDLLGDRLVPGHDRMHHTLRSRRVGPSVSDRVLQQVLGLRQKLDQYALGETFLRRLHERGGMALVNRVFAAPDALPTLAELRDPDRWLARAG